MALPIRTTLTDIDALTGYLVTKPTGATMAEAKAVLDSKVLDGRKINALKFWGLIDDTSGKMLVTERGRLVGKDKGARKAEALGAVVAEVAPYRAIVERAVHRGELSFSALEVAAHWHQHFKAEASANDKILNDQAVCFFQIAEGADLGKLVIGRKGQPTHFEFDGTNSRALAKGSAISLAGQKGTPDEVLETEAQDYEAAPAPTTVGKTAGNRVFITHGKNKDFIDREIPHLDRLLRETPEAALDGAQIVVVGHAGVAARRAIAARGESVRIVDLSGYADLRALAGVDYEGICW